AQRRERGGGLLDHIADRSKSKFLTVMQAKRILEEYAAKGYQLTLRQLYYQFVSRDLIPNSQKEYAKLGDAISEGRMWGVLDWDHIVDRGRNVISHPHWTDPSDIIQSAARGFRLDLWEESAVRPEVWVEKQALEEVVGRAAAPHDVSYIACKGYMSQSEMWAAGDRIKKRYKEHGQKTFIIHLGDHDPSGIDMSRDIEDRIRIFHVPAAAFHVERIALNMDQVQQYQPPPNPAKETDSRFQTYMEEFGDESWELDALEPSLLHQLIEQHIEEQKDETYQQKEDEQERMREVLTECSRRWEDVETFLGDEA